MQVIVCLSLFALMVPAASAKAQSGTYYYVDDYFKEKFEDGGAATPPTPALKSGVMMYVDSDAFHAKFGVLSQEKPKVNELVISPGDTLKAEDLAAAAGAPSAEETATGEEPKPIEVVVIPLKDEPVNVTPKGELVIAPEVVEPEVIAPEVVVVPEAIEPVEEDEEAEDIIVQKLETHPLVVTDAPTGAAVVGNATESGSQQSGMPLQMIIIGALVVVIVIMLVILLARKEPKTVAKQEKKVVNKAKSSGADWQEGDFLKTTVKAVKKDTKTAEKPAEKKPVEPKQEKTEVKPFLLKIRDES